MGVHYMCACACVCVFVSACVPMRVFLLLFYPRQHHIMSLIRHHDRRVRPSSLDAVRNRFHDLLADFHCVDKAIYTIRLHRKHVIVVKGSSKAGHRCQGVKQTRSPLSGGQTKHVTVVRGLNSACHRCQEVKQNRSSLSRW